MPCVRTYLSILFILVTFSSYGQKNIAQQAGLVHPDSVWNLRLHEIKVIARENRSSSTASFIGTEAIRHVQPFSLKELLQLIPGGITPDVSFQSKTYLNIRHLGTSPFLNSLGTGISIDGVRLSVNADLQQEPSNFSFSNLSASQSGIDARTIPTDNIENLEVIRGIPSVRFGDITSGMVIVHTRKQVRPYSATIRITPGIKAFNAGKGWQTQLKGILNLNAGYTRANSDINTTEGIYHRLSLQTNYTVHLNTSHPITLETGAEGNIVQNNNPDNLNFQPGEYIRSRQQNYRFHISGKWQVGTPLLSEISWKGTASYGHSTLQNNHFYSGVYSIGTGATEEGEHEGYFIPPQYWIYNSIESRPLSGNANLNASLRKSGRHWESNTLLGIEWTSEGNNGKGKNQTYYPPILPSQGNYDFHSFPFLHHYAIYLEEKLEIAGFTFEGGVRLTGISVRDFSFRPTLEPRLNLNYLLLQRPHSNNLRLLRLKGGFGLLRKIPPLGYLFHEPVYKNFTSYRDRNETSGESLAVLTTYLSSLTGATSLKLPGNLKAEIGLNGLWGNFSFDITGFYEYLKHGFGQSTSVRPVSYRIYSNPNEENQHSEYLDGEVYLNGQPAGYTSDTTFITNPSVHNRIYEHKGGIEFVFRTGYIRPLATTFVLDGAWILQRTEDRSITPDYTLKNNGNRSYPMCAFYESNTNYLLLQRLNTTLRAVTEIPALRLTSTISLQSIWLERSQTKVNKNTAKHFYRLDENGNRIENNLYMDDSHNKLLDPVYYMDTQGNLHPFTGHMATDPAYKSMVKEHYSRIFMKDSYSPYFLLNLRITKEIGQHFGLAFFANNLAKMNPFEYRASTGQYVEMNPPAFFGVELEINL